MELVAEKFKEGLISLLYRKEYGTMVSNHGGEALVIGISTLLHQQLSSLIALMLHSQAQCAYARVKF